MLIKEVLISLRVRHWIKNIVVFAALIFSKNLFDAGRFGLVLSAGLIFCVASSSVYLFNDIFDVELDRRHPRKRHRPIASGRLRRDLAFLVASVLGTWSLGMAYVVSREFFLILSVYILIEVFYSAFIKDIVILDIFCIASGFLLRVLAGAVVLGVPVSHWLLICTIFLSLFLALGKRRGEMVLLEGAASTHRPVLAHYDLGFIDQMITVVTASTILSYVLYTMAPETVDKFHTTDLKYTIIFVVYGVFRYLYLVYRKKEGAAPERLLFADKPLLVNVILYVVVAIAVVYR